MRLTDANNLLISFGEIFIESLSCLSNFQIAVATIFLIAYLGLVYLEKALSVHYIHSQSGIQVAAERTNYLLRKARLMRLEPLSGVELKSLYVVLLNQLGQRFRLSSTQVPDYAQPQLSRSLFHPIQFDNRGLWQMPYFQLVSNCIKLYLILSLIHI